MTEEKEGVLTAWCWWVKAVFRQIPSKMRGQTKGGTQIFARNILSGGFNMFRQLTFIGFLLLLPGLSEIGWEVRAGKAPDNP